MATGGALTALVNLLANGLSPSLAGGIMIVWSAFIAFLQNFLEGSGKIPVLLPTPALVTPILPAATGAVTGVAPIVAPAPAATVDAVVDKTGKVVGEVTDLTGGVIGTVTGEIPPLEEGHK
jgi:hypothetical protein